MLHMVKEISKDEHNHHSGGSAKHVSGTKKSSPQLYGNQVGGPGKPGHIANGGKRMGAEYQDEDEQRLACGDGNNGGDQ